MKIKNETEMVGRRVQKDKNQRDKKEGKKPNSNIMAPKKNKSGRK